MVALLLEVGIPFDQIPVFDQFPSIKVEVVGGPPCVNPNKLNNNKGISINLLIVLY
jgi:hypothetical protein